MQTKKTTSNLLTGVSLAEAKDYLRVTHAEDDGQIQGMISAAYSMAETYTGRTLLESTWRVTFSLVECRYDLWLPYPPHISVTTVEVADLDDNWSTVNSANYAALGDFQFQLVERNDGFVDSSGNGLRNADEALRVTYQAGYGDYNGETPDPVKQAILLLVRGLYDSELASYQSVANQLLNPYQFNRL